MKYAKIVNGVVDAVSLFPQPDSSFVEVDEDVFAGFIQNKNGSFSQPEAIPPSPRRYGEFREFMDLFTDNEQLGIILATQKDPIIKRWYDKAMGGSSFSLDHSQTELGLSALVSNGLLTAERKVEVLSTDFDARS
jgi:hypothetical protein